MTGNKIPKFDSLEEMARFWDTHDSADFQGDMEEVKEGVIVSSDPAFESAQLTRQQMNALDRIARPKGRRRDSRG